jgi:hypothetical protein
MFTESGLRTHSEEDELSLSTLEETIPATDQASILCRQKMWTNVVLLDVTSASGINHIPGRGEQRLIIRFEQIRLFGYFSFGVEGVRDWLGT